MFWLFRFKIYKYIFNDYKLTFIYYLLVFKFFLFFELIYIFIYFFNLKHIYIIILIAFNSLILSYSFLKLLRVFHAVYKTFISFLKFQQFGYLITFCGEPGTGKTRSAVYFSNLLALYNLYTLEFEKWTFQETNKKDIKNDLKEKIKEINDSFKYIEKTKSLRKELIFSNIKILYKIRKKQYKEHIKNIYKTQILNNSYKNDYEKIKEIKTKRKLHIRQIRKTKEYKTCIRLSNLLNLAHLMQFEKLPYKFIGVFDEIGAYLPIELSRSSPIDLDYFFRYIRHYTNGQIILTEQDSEHIPIFIRRIASKNIQAIKDKKILKSLILKLFCILADYYYKKHQFKKGAKKRKNINKIYRLYEKIGALKTKCLVFNSDISKNKEDRKLKIYMPCDNLVIYDSRAFSLMYKPKNEKIQFKKYNNEKSLKAETMEYIKTISADKKKQKEYKITNN